MSGKPLENKDCCNDCSIFIQSKCVLQLLVELDMISVEFQSFFDLGAEPAPSRSMFLL